MIQAVIFDLDNTLLDFMNMKSMAVEAAVHGMIEAGLQMDKNIAYNILIGHCNVIEDGKILVELISGKSSLGIVLYAVIPDNKNNTIMT